MCDIISVMKRRTSLFIILAVVLVIALASVVFKAKGVDERRSSSAVAAASGADYSLLLPHFVEMKGNDKVTDVKAESASYFKDEAMADLERPRMIFFGEGGKETHIEGMHGIINTNTNDLLVKGGVVARSAEGHYFKTESLKYAGSSKVVTTDDPVTIRGRSFVIKGLGMKLDVERETYYINKNVVAFFNVSGSEGRFD